MQIKKETKIYVETTDGKEMLVNNRYVFSIADKSYIGIYKGVNNRGALRFKNVLSQADVTFNVMPNSIDACYVANVIVGKGE